MRTSTGAFFGRGYDDVVKRIEKRIAQVTMIPVGELFSRQAGLFKGLLLVLGCVCLRVRLCVCVCLPTHSTA